MKNFIQSILILITVLISTAGAEEVFYAKVGEDVPLTCPRINSYKSVAWKFGAKNGFELAWVNHLGGRKINDDGVWKNKLSWSGDSLIIKDIQQENFGTFVCTRTIDDQIDNTPIKILRLMVSTPTSPLLPGESLSLSCSVDSQGHKRPEIYWKDPSGERKNQKTIEMYARIQQNGEWTCVVENEGRKKETKVSVTVVDFSSPSPHQYTSESMPLTIPCSIAPGVSWEQVKARDIQEIYWEFIPKVSSGSISAYPQKLYFLSLQDQLTWTSTGQHRELKSVPDPKKGDFSLSRRRGREEDGGKYTCFMKFKNGVTLQRTVHVDVLQIIAFPQTDLVSGQPLNLTCNIGPSLPSDLRVEWLPPTQSSLSLKPDHHPTNLIIKEVRTGDGGKWECRLKKGPKQLTSAVITLKIEPKLSVWMLVIICSAAAIVILILILIFIFCRRKQRKMRHLRHRLCQCKNPKPKGFYRT
ncbi:T-cell surface glycoprotein CD4-like [Trachinotus anak]|uniref:T-cell surface glycoprotein CD4-like n=1 Tax=Trachinotus anak TaxID=443729 RepID=UPI0039F2539E